MYGSTGKSTTYYFMRRSTYLNMLSTLPLGHCLCHRFLFLRANLERTLSVIQSNCLWWIGLMAYPYPTSSGDWLEYTT